MNNRKQNAHSYLIFIICIVLIAGCIIYNIPFYFGFFGSVIFSVGMLARKGHSIKSMALMMMNGVRGCTIVFVIIILIGANISVWLASGIVPSLIFYGFEYIKQINFVLACYVVTAVISVVMGTAVGTISTIGIALLGIGKGLSIPAPILLGAIVSGAFVADRLSPVSGLVNLTIKTTEVDYGHYARSLLKTLVPTALITAGIYYFIGGRYMAVVDSSRLQFYQNNLHQGFSISPFLLLLPLAVIVLAIAGVKPVVNMSMGVSGGVLLSLFYQGNDFLMTLEYIWSGYKSNTGIQELDNKLLPATRQQALYCLVSCCKENSRRLSWKELSWPESLQIPVPLWHR